MPVDGRRHPLLIYTILLDRWRSPVLGIGLAVLGLAAGLAWLPTLPTGLPFLQVPEPILWLTAGAGGFGILLSLLLLGLRRAAFVQPCHDHLKLATPFLRLRISYRRIRQTTTAEMGQLFPPRAVHGRARSLRASLSSRTVILIDLNGWPLPRGVLQALLSRFFFPDRTPRLALLVREWIGFSNELESYRSAWFETVRASASDARSDLLASIKRPGT